MLWYGMYVSKNKHKDSLGIFGSVLERLEAFWKCLNAFSALWECFGTFCTLGMSVSRIPYVWYGMVWYGIITKNKVFAGRRTAALSRI